MLTVSGVDVTLYAIMFVLGSLAQLAASHFLK